VSRGQQLENDNDVFRVETVKLHEAPPRERERERERKRVNRDTSRYDE